MDYISPEVLIYIQTVKNYFETNNETKEYFLSNSNPELFYEHMTIIAQKNFEKNGDATLDREQFELLRRTIIAITIAKSDIKIKNFEIKNEDFNFDNGVFIELLPNFELVCLN
jgi:hypothetical protein